MSVTPELVVRMIFRGGGEFRGRASAEEKGTSISEQSHVPLPGIG
jgi:hypothetical protein